MAISTGGITEEWGEPRQCLHRLMRRVYDFAPRQEGDYFVDIAFRSWDPRKEPEFHGVQSAMVGRKQRRFIVWHSVPVGLDSDDQLTEWFVSVLPETARLCREYLPTKSRAYPAEDLAREVEQLAAHLSEGTRIGAADTVQGMTPGQDTASPLGCAYCLDPNNRPYHLTQVAERPDTSDQLLRCPRCHTLWDTKGFGVEDRPLSQEEAARMGYQAFDRGHG